VLDRSGAIDAARRRAASFVEDAKKDLAALPASPARDLLHRLADAVLSREA